MPKTELEEIVERVARRDVPKMTKIGGRQAALVEAAALAALGARRALRASLERALDAGVAPEALREALIQTSPYAGAGRALDAEALLLEILRGRGIAEPERAGAVTDADRFERGLARQTEIFGDVIARMHAGLAPEERPIRRELLTAHCFGDFYTRGVLALPERELLTFCIIAALGGCDAQVRAHAAGNLALGTTRGTLLDALAVMCPWIGFPKTLNAADAVAAAADPDKRG